MRKNNIKGFVLAETIVVGVFLMGLLSILILNVLPLIGEYERISTYDNLDRKYDINLIKKMILVNNPTVISSSGYKVYTDKDSIDYSLDSDIVPLKTSTGFCGEMLKYEDYCSTLLGEDFLNITTLIVTRYNIQPLKVDSNYLYQNNIISRGLKEYISYLPSNLTGTGDAYVAFKDYRKIIVEFDDNTYASIEVPYE